MHSITPVPDDVTAWVAGVVGPFRPLRFIEQDHKYSRLWRIRACGDFLWLKMHVQPRKAAGEAAALSRWHRSPMPRLVAVSVDPQAMLIEELPGLPPAEVALSPEAHLRMWEEAGAFLASLHSRGGPAFGDGETDPVAWAREGYGKRSGRALSEDLLSPALARLVEDALTHGITELTGEPPRAAHKGFSPRNFLVGPNGELTGVIDFEHARWDLRGIDFVRSWDEDWRDDPRREAAFWAGYGPPDAGLLASLRPLRILHAACSVQWCHELGLPGFGDRNRRALERLAVG